MAKSRQSRPSAADKRPAAGYPRERARAHPSLFTLHFSLFTAAAAAAVAAAAVWFLSVALAAFDPLAAWSTVRAELMLFAATPGIQRLGYALPPLPTLLQVPLILIPAVRAAHLSAPIVSAAAGVAAVLGVCNGLSALGLGAQRAGNPPSHQERAGARVRLHAAFLATLTLLFAAQPLFLLDVGSGSGTALAAALVAWTAALLVRWEATGKALPLAASSFTLAAACLADYSVLLLIPAVLILLGSLAGLSLVQARAFMIAYVTPPAAAIVPWLIANAVNTGLPLTFHPDVSFAWTGQTLAEALSPSPSAHLIGDLALAGPPLLVGTLLAIIVAARTRRRRPALLALLGAGLALPALFDLLGWPLQLQFDPLPGITLGVMLAGWAVASVERWRKQPGRRLLPGLVAPAAVLSLVAGIGSQVWALDSGFAPQLGHTFVRALVPSTGGLETRPSGQRPAEQAAALLASGSGSHDVLADDRYDYPIIFFAANPAAFVTPDDDSFDIAASAPRIRLRWVVASRAGVNQPANAVETRYPGVYARGVAWADLAGDWSASGRPGWRLYRVRPAP